MEKKGSNITNYNIGKKTMTTITRVVEVKQRNI